MLGLKLFVKSLFNALLPKFIRVKLLRAFGRDYELSATELESSICAPNPSTPKGDFILSLTTFPKRISTLKYTLYSIFAQDLYPKKIVLCLSIFEFDKENLPQEIAEFEKWGIEILWSDKDIRQYNKIIPALRAFPNENIVTIDDDIFYPKGLLKSLWEAYNSDKNLIWAHRAREIQYKNGKLESFYKWKLIKKNHEVKPSKKLFLEGVGGVLYPPNALFKDALDESKFMKYSPSADDIWLWAMAVLNDKKIAVVKNNLMANGNAMTISPHSSGLWSENLIRGNDAQMSLMLSAYPKLREILEVDL